MSRRERSDKGKPRVDAIKRMCADFARLPKSSRDGVLLTLQTINDLDLQIPGGRMIQETEQPELLAPAVDPNGPPF